MTKCIFVIFIWLPNGGTSACCWVSGWLMMKFRSNSRSVCWAAQQHFTLSKIIRFGEKWFRLRRISLISQWNHQHEEIFTVGLMQRTKTQHLFCLRPPQVPLATSRWHMTSLATAKPKSLSMLARPRPSLSASPPWVRTTGSKFPHVHTVANPSAAILTTFLVLLYLFYVSVFSKYSLTQ